MNLLPSFFMLATLFFNAGGTFTNPDTHKITVNEGVRIETPCVQSVLHFEQTIGGESLVPKNWGIRVFASGVVQPDVTGNVSEEGLDSDDFKDFYGGDDFGGFVDDGSDDLDADFFTDEYDEIEEKDELDEKNGVSGFTIFSEIGCEFALGRINVGGSVSALKNPVPGLKKRWSAKTVSSMLLKSSLPGAKTGEKPLSALVSLGFGSFFAGFAAVGLETESCAVSDGTSEADAAETFGAESAENLETDEDSSATTSGALSCSDGNPLSSLGAESFLVQASFSPELQNGYRFFFGSTLSVAKFAGTKSSQFFSMKTFRQPDCLMNLLNVAQFSKSWGRTTLLFQDSFSAGFSYHKNGIAFCNDTLICLSGKGFSIGAGLFCADFGYVTASGAEIVEPLCAYGSFSFSFKIDGATIGVNAACLTSLSYDEMSSLMFPLDNGYDGGVVRTSAIFGLSVLYGDFSAVAESSVKNLCRKDNFADTICNCSFKLGFGGSSLQLNTKTPLFAVNGAPEWGIALNISGGKKTKLSGSVSGKFKGMEFSALKGSMTLSCGIVKLSASGSITSAQKITWSLSAQIKI